MDGQGHRTWIDGDTYKGEFKNGLQNGKGHYKSQSYEYEGGKKNNYFNTNLIIYTSKNGGMDYSQDMEKE